MRHRLLPILLTTLGPVLAIFLLAGCLSPQEMQEAVEERARWAERAGEPVERFDFNRLIEWYPLERDWVMLRFDRNRHLAVKLRQPCIAQVREANSLQLVQALPNRLERSADRVRLDQWVCTIDEMRPVAPPPREDGSG